jgi:DNA-binding transcriptional MocR family regulator
LPEGIDDRRASDEADKQGVEAQALSGFSIKHKRRGGLLLGYAGYDERQIRVGVRRLATALHSVARAMK